MFRGRFNFLTFAGIQIGIDLSWLIVAILLSWTLATGYFPYYYPGLTSNLYWLMGLLGMLGLFGCIVLHELGHAMVAKHYKLPISQITLFIFGGIAEIKKEPESPKVEFLMAIAGPIVSALLGVIFYLLTSIGEQHGWPILVVGITSYLTYINIVLVVFNMIPAFPLDGGRIFRSILWACTNNLALATKVSTFLGGAFGFFLIFWGIYMFMLGNMIGGVWMAIIGLFLRKAASSTRNQFFVSKELQGEKVARFMKTPPITVPPNISLKAFVDQYVYQSFHHLYPVTDGTRLLGYITLEEVKKTPTDEWEKTPVSSVMILRSQFKTVAPDMNAKDALQLMESEEIATLLVTQGDQLVGILTSQDLLKLISLKLELEQDKP